MAGTHENEFSARTSAVFVVGGLPKGLNQVFEEQMSAEERRLRPQSDTFPEPPQTVVNRYRYVADEVRAALGIGGSRSAPA